MKILLSILVFGLSTYAFAKDAPPAGMHYVYSITLKNGSKLAARYMEKTSDGKFFEIAAGSERGFAVRKISVDEVLTYDKSLVRDEVPKSLEKAAEEEILTKTLLDVKTAQPRYLNKRIKVQAVIDLSTYFNYSYRYAKDHMVAFRISDGKADAYLYAEASEEVVEQLRQRILKSGRLPGEFMFRIRAEMYDSDSGDIMAELLGYNIPTE